MDSGEQTGSSDIIEAIEGAALAVFADVVNVKAPAMLAVARLAGRFAQPDPNDRSLVIDRAALIAAILHHGRSTQNNAAAWFASRLDEFDVDARKLRLRPIDNETLQIMARDGSRMVPSISVWDQIIPTARAVARLTVKRDVIDIRHLVMAILHDRSGLQRGLGVQINANAMLELRRAIVAPLESNRERGELISMWRKLITTAPREIESERNQRGTATDAAAASLPRPDGKAVPEAPETPPPPPPPPPPVVSERITLQLGDPSQVDMLDRKPFADVLGDRINEVHAMQRAGRGGAGDQAYIIHLHGPWGSGKSTILNFLRDRLERGWIKEEQPEWLVVDFNAWKYQRLKPAWWTLMVQIQRAAQARDAERGRALGLHWHWLWLRFRLGTLSKQLGALLISVALILLYFWISGRETDTSTTKTLVAIAGLISGVFGIFNIVKSLVAKPETVIKAHAELTADPYAEVVTQFEALVARIPWPIIVFIDDLDRCEPGYVGDLLEHIQTMLRSAPIVYLVAADRSWITTSFSKRYADFTSHSQNPARPLGYLFLDKLFQLSVNMPSLSGPVRTRFLNAILGVAPATGQGAAATAAAATAVSAAEAAEAERLVSDKVSQEELLAEVEKAVDDPVRQQAVRVAVARRLGQSDVRAATEHRLGHMAALIEPNPRSMKNLVSAVAINQSRLVLEDRSFDLETLARWTIIELRWPLLADWLAQQPSRISGSPAAEDKADDPLVKTMQALLGDAEVSAVIKGHLDETRLRALIG